MSRLPNEILLQIASETQKPWCTTAPFPLPATFVAASKRPPPAPPVRLRQNILSALSLTCRLFLDFAREERYGYVKIDCLAHLLARDIKFLRQEDIARYIKVLYVTLFDQYWHHYLPINDIHRRDEPTAGSDTTAWEVGVIPHLTTILLSCRKQLRSLTLESSNRIPFDYNITIHSAIHSLLASNTFNKLARFDIATNDPRTPNLFLGDPSVRKNLPALRRFGILDTAYMKRFADGCWEETPDHSGRDLGIIVGGFLKGFSDLQDVCISQQGVCREDLWKWGENLKGIDCSSFAHPIGLEILCLVELQLSGSLSAAIKGFSRLRNLEIRRMTLDKNEDRWVYVFNACRGLDTLETAWMQEI